MRRSRRCDGKRLDHRPDFDAQAVYLQKRALSGDFYRFIRVSYLKQEIDSASESAGTPRDTEGTPQVRRFEHHEIMLDEAGRPIELGRGAVGVTYKGARYRSSLSGDAEVISERYLGDESAWLRFVRGARAAASVRHPNVASVFYLGRTGSNYFYAMEFVEGEILEHLIRRSGRVEGKLALEIATQVAAGLAAIHEQNLVHRDIKPSNVSECRRKSDSVTSGPPVEECLLTRQTRALAVVSCIVDLFAKLDFST